MWALWCSTHRPLLRTESPRGHREATAQARARAAVQEHRHILTCLNEQRVHEHGCLQELKPCYQDHLLPKSFTADAEAVPAEGEVAPLVNIVPAPPSLRGAAARDLQHAGRRRRRATGIHRAAICRPLFHAAT
ncbi:hypothetical protein NDU88_001095 [Pleurodeles waltl]|uniref:Uncharacterized protein n=1 Tax=Pleurodeles waltl TaxID=8319 RepID=A0AAV7P2V0_PLEWA|nr:hypothetical protein NDU88_001095 [Pleurodeles waltl]